MLLRILAPSLVFGVFPVILGYATWAIRSDRPFQLGPVPGWCVYRFVAGVEAFLLLGSLLGFAAPRMLGLPEWIPKRVFVAGDMIFILDFLHGLMAAGIESVIRRLQFRKAAVSPAAPDPLWDAGFDR